MGGARGAAGPRGVAQALEEAPQALLDGASTRPRRDGDEETEAEDSAYMRLGTLETAAGKSLPCIAGRCLDASELPGEPVPRAAQALIETHARHPAKLGRRLA